MRTQLRLRPCRSNFRPAQDAVFRLCNDFSQCGHRPACDPAGTVFRLCPRRLCLGIVTTSRSANTASPATLPEQLSVLLTTLCFGYVATSRSAGADPPATPPGQFTVLPKTTALKRCSGFSQGRAHVRQRPCRSSLTSCSGRPPPTSHLPIPLTRPTLWGWGRRTDAARTRACAPSTCIFLPADQPIK